MVDDPALAIGLSLPVDDVLGAAVAVAGRPALLDVAFQVIGNEEKSGYKK